MKPGFILAGILLLGAAALTGQAPSPEQKHLESGSAHLDRGEVEPAVQEFKAAVALNPQNAAAHMLLGRAYVAQRSIGMIAEAKAEFQQALDLDPTLLWARFYLARIYLDMGRTDKAKGELEKGLAAKPGVPHFLSLLGEAERKLGNYAASLDLHAQALAADPAMNTAHYYAALTYMDLKKDDDAISELERSIDSRFVAPEMYLTLGSLYTKRRRFTEAESVCKKAIALDPSRAEGYLNLGQLYSVQGASDKALAALHVALEGRVFPTSPYYQTLQADVFFETGRAHQAKHAKAEAIQAFERSLDYDSNRAETHQRLSELYQAQGDPRRASEHRAAAAKVKAGPAAQ
ncbi:MAG TPA: tetratricopeptide repeat protein [Bryobacteraceae bacterium]|nr:tetratricopeptide repeat protein [Bryobacteraceae bacterium]